jgi:hypothetical protein
MILAGRSRIPVPIQGLAQEPTQKLNPAPSHGPSQKPAR